MADAFQKLAFQTDAFEVGTVVTTLTADVGTYNDTGQDATLSKLITLTGAVGTFNVVGQDTRILSNYVLVGATTSYSLTGQDANTRKSLKVIGAATNFTLTGQAANTTKNSKVDGEPRTYTLTGQANNFVFNRKVFGDATSYTQTGQTATLIQTHIEPFADAFFPVTGQDARLSKIYTLTTGFTSGDRVFQQDAFQEDLVQTFVSQNDISIQGKDAFWHYQKAGTKVYVVV